VTSYGTENIVLILGKVCNSSLYNTQTSLGAQPTYSAGTKNCLLDVQQLEH